MDEYHDHLRELIKTAQFWGISEHNLIQEIRRVWNEVKTMTDVPATYVRDPERAKTWWTEETR